MNYSDIDSFMKKSGLDKEPAFDYLHIMTSDIKPTPTSRILGLYFPEGDPHGEFGYLPPSTTVLPPNVDTSTLLHELGHRHGHYYFNDISEPYAEEYRMAHERKLGVAMRKIERRPVSRGDICDQCEQNKLGRSKICMHCDYGGQYQHYTTKSVPLLSDWGVVGFGFSNPPSSIKSGNAITATINGHIKDLNAGFFDQWQVAVSVFWANPDNTLGKQTDRVYKGLTNEIDLNDGFNLGPMPNNDITLHAVLWANHDNRPIWPDALATQHGWDVIAFVDIPISVDTTPPPQTEGFGVSVYRGTEQLPSGGLVRPGEKLIFQADGTPGTVLSIEFILTNSLGKILIDTTGAVNIFEQKASAHVTAPNIEGDYMLIGRANNWYSNQYSFTVSHLASEPPAGTQSWQDQIGGAIKMVAVGGLVIAGVVVAVNLATKKT